MRMVMATPQCWCNVCPPCFQPFFFLTKYSSTLLTDEDRLLRNRNIPALSSCNRDRKFYLVPRTSKNFTCETLLPFLIIQPIATSIFGRSNEGRTLETSSSLSLRSKRHLRYLFARNVIFVISSLDTSSSLSLRGGNLTLINLFDTKFSCFTSPATQHHSFIRN